MGPCTVLGPAAPLTVPSWVVPSEGPGVQASTWGRAPGRVQGSAAGPGSDPPGPGLAPGPGSGVRPARTVGPGSNRGAGLEPWGRVGSGSTAGQGRGGVRTSTARPRPPGSPRRWAVRSKSLVTSAPRAPRRGQGPGVRTGAAGFGTSIWGDSETPGFRGPIGAKRDRLRNEAGPPEERSGTA